MILQRDHPFARGLGRILVVKFDRHHPIDFLLQLRSVGRDAIAVPTIVLLDLGRLVLVFPAQGSASTFFVEFPPTAIGKISLIARHDPLVRPSLGMLGTILNPAVPLPADQNEIRLEHVIGKGLLEDQERIPALQLFDLPGDVAILHPPYLRVSIPPGQVFTIEEADPAPGIGFRELGDIPGRQREGDKSQGEDFSDELHGFREL